MIKKLLGIVSLFSLVHIAVSYGEKLPVGEGSFYFPFPNVQTNDSIKVFYYIPEEFESQSMPVVVGFHGNDRDCSYWIDTWKEYASEKGFMFFIPWFTKEDFPTWRYQEAGIKNDKDEILSKQYQTSVLVDSLLSNILKISGTKDSKVTIYGHSAGGQFVHRFMLLNDSPYVKKAIIGNPGWFTFPDNSLNYSYGIKDLIGVDENRMKSMLGKNIILQLGLGDTIRESFLRKTPEADSQGLNRLERGNNFYEALSNKARELNTDFNWRKVYVPEVGHDAVAMSRHAALNLLSDSILIMIPDQPSVLMSSDWLHRYDDEIKQLELKSNQDPDTVCDAVFIGSSSIRLWPDLQETMSPLIVKNRGYGGATMRDLMRNYKRVMAHYKPKNIVFYCDNDISGWEEGDLSVDQVFSLYKTFIETLRKEYPETMFYFLSIKHSLLRERLREEQEMLNSLMKDYSSQNPSLTFVDTTTPLLDIEGNINDSLFQDDHLHLNKEGYRLWNEKLRPLLLKYQ